MSPKPPKKRGPGRPRIGDGEPLKVPMGAKLRSRVRKSADKAEISEAQWMREAAAERLLREGMPEGFRPGPVEP